MVDGSDSRTPVVLMADDDPAIVGLVEALVQAEGLGFVGVTGGEAALAAAEKGPVDLVLDRKSVV